MKRFAIRGLIVLAVVVALCMFFSGTIRTITTPKVKLYSPKQGKLEQTVELTAKTVFPESKPVTLPGAKDLTLNIASVKVGAGYEVEEGDLLFTASIADYDKNVQTLRDTYDQTNRELMELEQKNKGVRLRQIELDWREAYCTLSSCQDKELESRIEMETLLRVEGLSLNEDGTLPEGASEELTAAFEKNAGDREALSQAEEAMALAERYNIDENVRSYITGKLSLEEKLADCEQQLLNLSVMQVQVQRVTAPEDGFITEINVKAGETFDANTAAYSFCPAEEMPVLRVDTEDSTLTISKGTEVTFEGAKGSELESEVIATGVTPEGRKYADVELTKKLLKGVGGSSAIADTETTIKIFYKAKQSTTLLPSSAVRGSGEDRYVYVAREQQSAFGTKSLVIAKLEVTVLAEVEGVCSISDEISWEQVAYMEDRAISEGTTVMEYVN
ncbi:MAG TPA: hypothetical protein IAB02_06675 [Candidatus Pullichristensenella excrementigallinarum]|uniref:Uncharacterized protein n=1 Tax=Candidatus Pullichristensenella excrementigallinarum TaxID=2840907 RepID=A0A9D1ICR6_9FIRM|nr:hypothetical protein [Candidatus Pullichristensenella excrementigallinarum]